MCRRRSTAIGRSIARRLRMALKKIVSGGQTGVDRAALDAALAVGFPCGGWASGDRTAEDGTIPERYPRAFCVIGGSLLFSGWIGGRGFYRSARRNWDSRLLGNSETKLVQLAKVMESLGRRGFTSPPELARRAHLLIWLLPAARGRLCRLCCAAHSIA